MPKPEAELKKAIKKGEVDRVEAFLDEGVPVDSELPAKVTALEFALACEQRAIVDCLLARGARPRAQKRDNLLIDVPKFRDLDLLERLVQLGADVHAPDKHGMTPLLSAVAAAFHDGVRFLIDRDADATLRTKNGQSVFDLAAGTRRFAEGLLPGSEGELAELFGSQLADLDRIEALLESRLTRDEVSSLRGREPEPPQSSTFWEFEDGVEFRLEISPFPFQSRLPSRLEGRLGRYAELWESNFRDGGRILYRVRPSDTWTAFALVERDGCELVFESETHLSPGRAIVELQFDTTVAALSKDVGAWEIDVAG